MIAAFDTNILVYACDKRDPERQAAARSVLRELEDGVLLWQVACEFLTAARKLNDQGFTPQHAWDRLAEVLDLVPLVLPGFPVLERARQLQNQYQCAFWDAMIFAACLEAGVQRLYSEDLPGCPIAGLEIINPFAR